eukprot:3843105-Pyramimonas_sp.AAC.1
MTPPCEKLTALQNMTPDSKRVDLAKHLREVLEAKRYVSECARIAEYQMSKGRHFLFEAPPTATTYNLPPMKRLLQNPKVFTGITSGCRVGLRHPISGLLLSKRWKFVSSSPEAA